MIQVYSTGSFKNTDAFLDKMQKGHIFHKLEKYGQEGVTALASMTPVDSGETAKSWDYKVKRRKGIYSITWTNDNIVNGVPVAIMIQYGHGTGTGGWVAGRDFINPAIQYIFDRIADDMWREVIT